MTERSGPPRKPSSAPRSGPAAGAPRHDWYRRFNLRPRHLELLLTLDELRNVAAAASVLNVTQPAVSKTLAAIEEELGVTLFKRTPRGLESTEMSTCIARHARSILEEYARAGDELGSMARGVTGKVGLGATPGPSLVVVPGSIARFKQRSPETRVVIQGGNNEGLISMLRTGSVELIVVMMGPTHGLGDLSSTTLYEEELVLAAGPNHPLAAKSRTGWADLAGMTWVLPPYSRTLRLLLEDAMRERGIVVQPNYIETLSLEVYVGLLRETDAVAFLPHRAARHYEQFGLIRILPLTLPTVSLPVNVMWLRDKPLDPMAKIMLECLRETGEQLRPR